MSTLIVFLAVCFSIAGVIELSDRLEGRFLGRLLGDRGDDVR